jgi:Skp family chaperone for outer membrane proteins
MKTFRLIALGLLFAAVFAGSSFAQTTAGKIGLINTAAFNDEKAGIAKYIAAKKSLDVEFKKDFDDLNSLVTRMQNLEKELNTLEGQINAAATEAAKAPLQTSYTAKFDEQARLLREHKFKQEDTKVRYQRREQILLGPVLLDIRKAIQEYSKQKSYYMVLDAATLFNAGILLAWDDASDITVDFIKFYNARPATAVTNTK